MKVFFLAPAVEELREAARLYESQAKGLGDDFLSEVRAAMIEGVARRSSEALSSSTQSISRRLVRRFPYGLLYRVENNEILVIGVVPQ